MNKRGGSVIPYEGRRGNRELALPMHRNPFEEMDRMTEKIMGDFGMPCISLKS